MKTNISARLGGDEFTILLEDIRGVSDATLVAERLINEMMRPCNLGGHEIFVSTSIGISISTTGYQNAADILRDADTAMYRAKTEGKSRYEIFDPTMRDQMVARMQLETDLRRVVENQEFKQSSIRPLCRWLTGRLTALKPSSAGNTQPAGSFLLRSSSRWRRRPGSTSGLDAGSFRKPAVRWLCGRRSSRAAHPRSSASTYPLDSSPSRIW